MNDFKIGDIVVFTNQERHYKEPQYFPPPGTKGEILAVEGGREETGEECLYVKWPAATTSRDDCWYCDFDDVVKEADDES